MQKKQTFITNFFDTADEILQLCISDEIWQKYGFDQPIGTSVNVNKRMLDDNNGVFIIDGDVVAGFHQDFENSKWIFYGYKRY